VDLRLLGSDVPRLDERSLRTVPVAQVEMGAGGVGVNVDDPGGRQSGVCASQLLRKTNHVAGAAEVFLGGQHMCGGVGRTKALTMDQRVGRELLGRGPRRLDVPLGFGAVAQPSR